MSVLGPTGPRGVKGDQGLVGTTGEFGSTGPSGLEGRQGFRGLAGVIGITGPVGKQGPTGARGVQGFLGATGPQGTQGPTGVTGAFVTGPTGPVGNSGSTGFKGSTGLQGGQGNAGVLGLTGPQGLQGMTGPTGAFGAGPMGSLGPAGSTGATGIHGPGGTVGPTGVLGSSSGFDPMADLLVQYYQIVESGLISLVMPQSYSGSGSIWNDLKTPSNNWNIITSSLTYRGFHFQKINNNMSDGVHIYGIDPTTVKCVLIVASQPVSTTGTPLLGNRDSMNYWVAVGDSMELYSSLAGNSVVFNYDGETLTTGPASFFGSGDNKYHVWQLNGLNLDPSWNNILILGYGNSNQYNTFSLKSGGRIAGFALYNRVLTVAEMRQNAAFYNLYFAGR